MGSSHYPREKYIESHPREHGLLKLKPAQNPYHCGGCNEYEIYLQECYQCEHQICGFHLHKNCDPLSDSIWLQVINRIFTFEKEAPRGKEMVCDGCGMDVNGWFYQDLSRGNPRYLHPCCAKLPFKKREKGGIVLVLKEKTKSSCLICGNDSKDFRSWVYVSRCGNYCYHVSCVKGKVEKWKKEEASNQQPSYETGTSSGALVIRAPNQDVQPNLGEKVLDPSLKIVVEILNSLIFVICGIPALPFLSVAEWIIKKC